MNNNRFCMIEGNLVKDPIVKELQSGKQVAQFTVAVNYKTAQEEQQVCYFDVEAWSETARYCGSQLAKGSWVSVLGNLKQERWEKDGKVHSKIKVVANSVHGKMAPVPGAEGNLARAS